MHVATEVNEPSPVLADTDEPIVLFALCIKGRRDDLENALVLLANAGIETDAAALTREGLTRLFEAK